MGNQNEAAGSSSHLISPTVEAARLPITADAPRGDGRVRQIPYSFAARLIALLEARGLGDFMTIRHDQTPKPDSRSQPAEQDEGADYFMTESTLRGPGGRRLGLATRLNTFSQWGSGETVLHEGTHRKVAQLLGPEVFGIAGKEVDEALAFAMEVVVFGNREDVYRILSNNDVYSTREAYLTAHFLRVYYMAGTVQLLALVKKYAEVLRKHPEYRLDDLLLLADRLDDDTSPAGVRKALEGKPGKFGSLFGSFLGKTAPAAKSESTLILEYFTGSFGISETSARHLIARQGYRTLEDAVVDLSEVKVSGINAENRLNTMFYLTTKQSISAVRARTAEIVALDMQADAAASLAGMNDAVAKLYEIFGQDAVAEMMGVAMVSPLVAEQLAQNLPSLLDLCGHDRETALMFSEKFSTDVHFRRFILGGGVKHLIDLYRNLYGWFTSLRGEDPAAKNSKVRLLRALLDYRFDWRGLGPVGTSSREYIGSYDNLKSAIVDGVPPEIHTHILALLPRLCAVALLDSLICDDDSLLLNNKAELTFIHKHVLFLNSSVSTSPHIHQILESIINESKQEFGDAAAKNYAQYCEFMKESIARKIGQLDTAFRALLDSLANR